MRNHPKRAKVDPTWPRAWATSDRSGFIGNKADMAWQHEWAGLDLFNKRVLVHDDELDIPQRQLGVLILPPDPTPIRNARPENYVIDEEPVSSLTAEDGRVFIVTYTTAPLFSLVITNTP